MTKTNPKFNHNLLIIDDDELILHMMTSLVDKLGIRITTCATGNKGIELFQEAIGNNRPFDAVIVDVHLAAGVSGAEVIEKLFQLDPHARIISTSGYSDDPLIKTYKKFGISGSLPKPFNREQLINVLSEVFSFAK